MEVNSPKGFKNGELSSEEIKKLFADINKGEIDYIEKTLEKDTAKTTGDAFN